MIVKKTNGQWNNPSVPTYFKIDGVPHNLRNMPNEWENNGYFEVDVPEITEYQELITLTDLDVSNGNQRVRDFNAQEILDHDKNKAEQLLLSEIRQERFDGSDASEKLVLYIRQLNLSPPQLLNAKKVLLPVYKSLKDGNWDIAQEEINLINRPSGAFGVVYDTIKTKIILNKKL